MTYNNEHELNKFLYKPCKKIYITDIIGEPQHVVRRRPTSQRSALRSSFVVVPGFNFRSEVEIYLKST